MRPFAWCLVAALLFGASTPAAKSLIDSTGPLLLSGLLYLGAALAVLPLAVRSPHRQGGRTSTNRWRLIGAVVLGGIVAPVLLMKGLEMAPAGSVSLWLTLETVATAVLARFFFKEHLGTRGAAAVLLVVGASAVLADQPQLSGAVFLVLLACVAWGLDNNLTSLIDTYTPAQVTLAKGVTAGAVLIPLGLSFGDRSLGLHVPFALAIGALGYGWSLVLYVAAAQQLGATRSQLIFSSAPIFGVGLSWVALGEPIGWRHGVAAALMALALRLLHAERHAHPHQHEALVHTHWHRHDDDHHEHAHPTAVEEGRWHLHPHRHEARDHCHPHRPDLHHRHRHAGG